jgi:hypothetical protein
MPTVTKLKSGSWRVQVRRKHEYVANTFIRRRDAEEWAIEVERSIDRGAPIRRSRPHEQPRIFSDLIARCISMILLRLVGPFDDRNLWRLKRSRLANRSAASFPRRNSRASRIGARWRPIMYSIWSAGTVELKGP